jgi:hypothetical protein
MCGKEFCNAYTELNDPFEQRLRFEEQVGIDVFAFWNSILTSCFVSRSDKRSKAMMRLRVLMRHMLMRSFSLS